MSTPRYILTLRVSGIEFDTSIKLRTVFGDHQGLQDELAIMTSRGEITRLAENLTETGGGLEEMRSIWLNNKETSDWYNCAHCEAGYPDQECTCEGLAKGEE